MSEEEKLYTMKEISLATGIKSQTLHSRRRARNIPANRSGYTVAQVKMILKRRDKRRASTQNARELRARLLNDGAL